MVDSNATAPATPPLTPDFYCYPWTALASARATDTGTVQLRWPDGVGLECHPFWLLENAVREGGIDLATRELTLDPAHLPDTAPACEVAVVEGALEVTWPERPDPDRFHPGWLRHVADGRHRPSSGIPLQVAWTAATLSEPPTRDGSAVLEDDAVLLAWLADLATHGLARLSGIPSTEEAIGDVVGRIGALRETNFGVLWWVRADIDPNSTANTGLRLPPHSDLPTRETPPGFQFLHCLENSAAGGTSRMTDGLALCEHLRAEEPDVYDALTTLPWVFFNRSQDHDHRWTGPIIDHGAPGQPLTLRAFHPVRAFPEMPPSEVGRAYAALKRFSTLAADPRFQIGYPFRPGDLVGFDNRRVLHARDAYEPTAGTRVLRGCYLDHDELYSRLRVLHRRATPPAPPSALAPSPPPATPSTPSPPATPATPPQGTRRP